MSECSECGQAEWSLPTTSDPQTVCAVCGSVQESEGVTMKTFFVTSKDFGYAVKFLKKRGYTFCPAKKTWSGTGDVEFLVEEGYITEVQPPRA
jgi:hypothetical protein